MLIFRKDSSDFQSLKKTFTSLLL